MKIVILICTILLFCCASEVIRPPFLIDGEPIPAAVTAHYSYGSNKYHEQFLDIYPVTIGSSEHFLLFPNIGFMGEQYGSDDSLPDRYSALYAGFFATGSIGSKLEWHTYQSWGAISDSYHSMSEGFKYFQMSFMGYKFRPNFALSGGLLINSRYGHPIFLPMLRIAYSKNRFVFEGNLPVTASVRFNTTENFHIVGTGKLFYMNFAAEEFSNGVDISRSEIMITAEKRLKNWWWCSLGAGYGGETPFSEIEGDTIGDIENGLRVRFSVIIRPEVTTTSHE